MCFFPADSFDFCSFSNCADLSALWQRLWSRNLSTLSIVETEKDFWKKPHWNCAGMCAAVRSGDHMFQGCLETLLSWNTPRFLILCKMSEMVEKNKVILLIILYLRKKIKNLFSYLCGFFFFKMKHQALCFEFKTGPSLFLFFLSSCFPKKTIYLPSLWNSKFANFKKILRKDSFSAFCETATFPFFWNSNLSRCKAAREDHFLLFLSTCMVFFLSAYAKPRREVYSSGFCAELVSVCLNMQRLQTTGKPSPRWIKHIGQSEVWIQDSLSGRGRYRLIQWSLLNSMLFFPLCFFPNHAVFFIFAVLFCIVETRAETNI